MLTDTAAVRAYFQKLGLESEIADIYLSLHANGPQTISELSRSSGVERTRIYRLIDRLMDTNLVEIETRFKRGIIKAAPIANLNILISQKEQELKSLQDELGLLQQVLARNSLSSPTTRVQFYEGPEGAKQMFWNQLRAKTEVLCFLNENMQSNTKSKFFERWVERNNKDGIRSKGIFNRAFIESQRTWYKAHANERLKHWEGRLISETAFPITHSQVIYNDITSYYNWTDGEVFGIEIYNQEIADAQRRLFTMLWNQATPVDDLTGEPKE